MREKNFSTMKERILKYMKSRKMGQNAFETYCGLSLGTISKINLGLRGDKIALIAKACPDLDIRWLLTGEGDMLVKKEEPAPVHVDKGVDLPLLPFSAVAGFLSENNSSSFPGAVEMCRIPEFTGRGADFLIRVDGDSMYPRYHNGEILAVRKIRESSFLQWGKVYVLSTSQGCIVKRIFPFQNDDTKVTCHSENSEMYPDYQIPKEEIYDLGIVVGHIGVE